MKSKTLAIILFAIFLLLPSARAASSSVPGNAFFAMDTALSDGKNRGAAEQAALLKELGYDGIGASGYVSDDFLAAFDQKALKVCNTYLTLSFDSAKPGLDPKLKEFVARLKGRSTDLWIAIGGISLDGVKLKVSATEGDDIAVRNLRELADLAQVSGVKIALYPHTWFWIERVDDALRVAKKVDRANLGATFNLCHWLKVEGDRDPKPVIKEALPHLFFVSINGADRGDTKAMEWDRLIQPLDHGSYDVAAFLRLLKELGYAGPIGFQGYGIKGDSKTILQQTMDGWEKAHLE